MEFNFEYTVKGEWGMCSHAEVEVSAQPIKIDGKTQVEFKDEIYCYYYGEMRECCELKCPIKYKLGQ